MAGRSAADVLRHSVLDRLVGASGGTGHSTDLRIGVRDLKRVVRRDIEWLLNTRQSLPAGLDDLPEAASSLLAYGIPDLSLFSSASAVDRHRVGELIEEIVRTFEPRLVARTVKVEYLPADEERGTFEMRFRIHGLLHVEPVKEPVAFDTSIELDSGNVQIETAD